MLLGKGPSIALSVFVLMLPAFPASATTATYSTYQTWMAAVNNAIELNFTKVGGSGQNYSTSAGKTMFPTSGPAVPFIFTGPYSGGYQLTTAGFTTHNIVAFYGPANGQGNLTITLPSGGENAILLGLGASNGASNISVALSDGETFNVTPGVNTTAFLGISLSHDVSWVTVTAPTQPIVDDFFFGQSQLAQDPANPGTAPTAFEGSTFSLIGGGLLSLLGIRRKLPRLR